jgi:hypothetical protein
MFFSHGIIDEELPKKNKYTNFKNIQTISYDKMNKLDTNRAISLIRSNYLCNGANTFSPKKENILPYFIGHNIPCYFTFYYDNFLIQDLKDGAPIEDDKLISVVTCRPLHIIINSKNSKSEKNEFIAYYVDYLCVDKMYRKKGIAPQMIQTHYYNQRHSNKSIHVNLFKREEDLTGIVPLCVYSTFGFRVTKWHKPRDLLPPYTLLEITPQNYHHLHDFIKKNNNAFDIMIYPEITNVMELLKTNNIFIYVVMHNGVIISAYFYRKTCIFIEKNMETLSCFASINSDSTDIFIHGFKVSFWRIAEKHYFGFAAIENISHNREIIANIKIKTEPAIISPTAYFFYNFAYPTFKADKVFIIN